MATNTITVKSSSPTGSQLVSAGEGPTLIVNSDPTQSIVLSNSNSLRSSDPASSSGAATLGPLQALVVDGTDNWYAIPSAPGSVVVYTFAGGIHFFQPSTRITAGQFVAQGPGSGFFDYIGTGALENPPVISITEGVVDPFGNTVLSGIVIIDTNPARPDYIQLLPGSPPTVNIGTGDAGEAVPGKLQSGILPFGSTKALAMLLSAPRVTGQPSGALANIGIQSPTEDLVTASAQVQLSANDGTNSALLSVTPVEIDLTTSVGTGAGFRIGNSQTLITGFLIADSAWHNISLAAGFSNGSRTPQYRVFPDGTIHLTGFVNVTANQVAGTTFGTVPFNATKTVDFITDNSCVGNALGAHIVQATVGTGNLVLEVAANTGQAFGLDGVVIPLI